MLNLFKRKQAKTDTKTQLSAPDESIRRIVQGITKLSGPCKSLLLAGNRITDLPVTTPVNLAVELSAKGSCLLIDLDYKRNPIARVFDIDSSKLNPDLKMTPLKTPLKDVDLWPAEYFSLLKQMNLRSLLESARKKYTYIILYAPYLATLVDRKQIASCAGSAVVFETAQDKQNSELDALFKACKCQVLFKTAPSP